MPAPPAITLAEATREGYLGQYESAEGIRISVESDGGKLRYRITDLPGPVFDLIPTSETELHYAAPDGSGQTLTFVHNNRGDLSHVSWITQVGTFRLTRLR